MKVPHLKQSAFGPACLRKITMFGSMGASKVLAKKWEVRKRAVYRICLVCVLYAGVVACLSCCAGAANNVASLCSMLVFTTTNTASSTYFKRGLNIQQPPESQHHEHHKA